MKIKKLEAHQYAPELNKLHLANGVIIPAPGCFTIAEVRARIFHRVKRSGKYAVIKYVNRDNLFLNREYSGFCENGYKSLQFVLGSLKKRHNMPGGSFNVSIKYIGE